MRDISVGLMFKGRLPPARLHPAFLEEIAAFGLARAHQIGTSSSTTYWPPSFSTDLMRGSLRSLILRRNSHAEWYSDLSAGWVPFPDFNIADIVTDKSRTQFRPAKELWLVIECGPHISETMLNLFGVEDFKRVPSFEHYQFERVIVLAYNGAYQWERREGWRRLTGEDREDRGPTLDELKAALIDPGWREDPDGKAREVAAKTLRDLRG
jgi:hypothetical protein